MELRWRFEIWVKYFKNEKNGVIVYLAFILNEFGPKVNKWIHRVYEFGLYTWLRCLRFCILLIRKACKKSKLFWEKNRQVMSAITGTNLTKNNKKFNLDSIQGIDYHRGRRMNQKVIILLIDHKTATLTSIWKHCASLSWLIGEFSPTRGFATGWGKIHTTFLLSGGMRQTIENWN
jgi:hypothetical protein